MLTTFGVAHADTNTHSTPSAPSSASLAMSAHRPSMNSIQGNGSTLHVVGECVNRIGKLALPFRRTETTFGLSLLQTARCKAVKPSVSLAPVLAPASMRAFVTSAFLFKAAAKCRGVVPSAKNLALASGSAPLLIISTITPGFLFSPAAKCNAVNPGVLSAFMFGMISYGLGRLSPKPTNEEECGHHG